MDSGILPQGLFPSSPMLFFFIFPQYHSDVDLQSPVLLAWLLPINALLWKSIWLKISLESLSAVNNDLLKTAQALLCTHFNILILVKCFYYNGYASYTSSRE